MNFRPHTETPNAAGWYRTRRVDDTENTVRIRAFGQGHWWIPLPGGWLSADGVYEWESLPVCGISDDDELDPIDELKQAEAVAARTADPTPAATDPQP